jgi:hypothetical protein
MAEFAIGETVQVVMPKGFTKRGIPGISVMYTTWPESRFEGAVGTITDISPRGTHGIPLFLVDFRGHDQGRVAIPWQAQWFREEWIMPAKPASARASKERPRDELPAAKPGAPQTEAPGTGGKPAGARTTVREESQADPVAPAGAAGSAEQSVPSASGVSAPEGTESRRR